MHDTVRQRLINHFEQLKEHPSEIKKHNMDLLVPSIIWELLEEHLDTNAQTQTSDSCSWTDNTNFSTFGEIKELIELMEILKNNKTADLKDLLELDTQEFGDFQKSQQKFFSLANGLIQSDFSRIANNLSTLPPHLIKEIKKDMIEALVFFIELYLGYFDGTFDFMPHDHFSTTDEKIARYAQLHFEMIEFKEEVSPIIEAARIDGKHEIINEFESKGKVISLVANNAGCGGSYYGEIDGAKEYVVKPVDEEIGAYNNRKGFKGTKSIFESLETEIIPTYMAPINDLMMYDLACILGIEGNVPQTAMMVVENDAFHDAFANETDEIKQKAINLGAGPDNAKLCTVQKYVKNSKPVIEVWQDFLIEGCSAAEFSKYIDQEDFENLNLLMWLSSELDGHLGNILATVKGLDDNGNKIFGLVKIDSSFSFPKEEAYYGSALNYFDNSKMTLSDKALSLIENIDINQIIERMQSLKYSDAAQSAMKNRILALQSFAKENLTIKEIEYKMTQLSFKETPQQLAFVV